MISSRFNGGGPALLVLRLLYNEAVRLEGAALDARTRLLANMISVIEQETQQAFADTSIEDIVRRAGLLGRNSRRFYIDCIRLAQDVAERMGIADAFSRDAALVSQGLNGWAHAAEHAERLLPMLSPSARIHVRASWYLVSAIGNRDLASEGAPSIDHIATQIENAGSENPGHTAMGLIQALIVFGLNGGLSSVVIEAMASELWIRTRALRHDDEDMVEDAYWAARADESKLEGGPMVSSDDLMARTQH